MASSSAPADALSSPLSRPPRYAHQAWNFFTITLHQIVFRIGWTFKTEGILVPHFVDTITRSDVVRGLLPTINRLGESLLPVWWARRLKAAPRKARGLVGCSLLLSIPYAVLAAVWWWAGEPRPWMAWLFLGLHLAFRVTHGLYQLAAGTVQGKLIRPTLRGALLAVPNILGVVPVVVLLAWLLPGWLDAKTTGWTAIFALVAACLFGAGVVAALLREAPDPPSPADERPRGSLADTWRVLRGDGNLRLLVAVAILFSSALIVVPHYQAFAKKQLARAAEAAPAAAKTGGDAQPAGRPLGGPMTAWVIAQTISVSLCTLVVGPLGDRFGYRLTLRLLIFGSALVPLLAIGLPHLPEALGSRLLWVPYVPLGMTPLLLPALTNYTLEIAPREEHPRYLSTVSLGLLPPHLASPAVGWLVGKAGFANVFCGVAALTFAGGCLTFWLAEPRTGRARKD